MVGMYDCVHLQRSAIEFVNAKRSNSFIKKLHSIKNFSTFFDKLEVDGLIEDGDSFELTYDDKGLDYNEIRALIEDISKLCNEYGYLHDATVKVLYDGRFLLYLVVHDNLINDITDKINKVMEEEERRAINELP
jgi:hypothetical protein